MHASLHSIVVLHHSINVFNQNHVIGLRVEARLQHHAMNYQKLFVFGDSYVDTGNTRIDQPGSWKNPYGITFPGKPAGRFSDGRVITDYIGKSSSLSLFLSLHAVT
ncbi:hypothetical protein V8G54_029177 [Vigna mungo]|uniref:GDSL esterase/lipase n=1 Tax=Vigna mungo TaxID=3915 RepID=A0AAQ3MU30_VIGMU